MQRFTHEHLSSYDLASDIGYILATTTQVWELEEIEQEVHELRALWLLNLKDYTRALERIEEKRTQINLK